MTINEIREALSAAGLDRLADEAERLTLPAIRITAEMADEADIPIGASKIGGRPDLPVGVAWPERDGRPLAFLAQFNLAEVAAYDVEHALPPTGMLYFFYDFTNERCGVHHEDRDSWRVMYFDGGPVPLSRSKWPAPLPRRYRLLEHMIRFSSILTVTHEPDWVLSVLRNDDERRRFREAREKHDRPAVEHATERAEVDDFEYRATRHQLLGHPYLVHYGTMPLVCEYLVAGRPNPLFTLERVKMDFEPHESWDENVRAELASAYKRWRLFFQLGNVSGLSFPRGADSSHPLWRLCDLWARGGLMYFWIERDHLAQRDFSRMWMLGASQF